MKSLLAITVVSVLILMSSAQGSAITLTSGNSCLTFDPWTDAAYDWKVNGQDQLFKEQFFYRVGNTGGESSFAPLFSYYTQPSADVAIAHYVSLPGLFSVDIRYDLDGGAPGYSTLNEDVTICATLCPLDYHLFEYTDLNLNGNANDDKVQISLLNGGLVAVALQTDPTGPIFSESIGASGVDHVEAALVPQTLNKLTDGLPTTLNGVLSAGPGDVSWAFQWDLSIPAWQSVSVHKVKTLQPIPEPVTMFGLLMSIGGVAGYWRKHRMA